MDAAIPIHEGWIDNGPIRLHYLDANAYQTAGVALVIVPGLTDAAADYLDLMTDLAPRRCIAVSLRGRGKSDAPATGYGLADHVGDLTAAIDHFKLNRFCLLGFSRGVSYALAHALRHPAGLAGLVAFDYPAQHRRLPPGYAAGVFVQGGGDAAGGMTYEALLAVERESHQVDLWADLPTLDCPALIVRGSGPSALLDEEDLRRYQQGLRRCQTLVLDESGHTVTDADADRFVAALAAFLRDLD